MDANGMKNMSATTNERLISVDALRGFDMCWILGLGTVVQRWLKDGWMVDQLEHVDWEGFRFYDLIFPLFLFLSGVSMSIAVPRRLAASGSWATARHLLWRAVALFVLGVIFSGGFKDGWDGVRWLGVLQRIGIASALAGLLLLHLSTRGLVMACLSLLLGYCLLLGLAQVPSFGAGDFREGHNLTNYLDRIWLPGRKYDGDHDPEGLLSTLPAVATALLGILAGRWLQVSAPGTKKSSVLVLAGAALIILGWLWHPFFPVIKKLWTSSFVLVAGGWSAVLLGAFYWLVDVQGWRKWTLPFIWVGSNPILLYLLAGFGAFRAVAERLGGAGQAWLSFVLMLALAGWLHHKRIFVRV
jgi:predicted acyltransferase